MARRRSLAHAVELLTTRRQEAAIVSADYPSRIKAAFAESDDAIVLPRLSLATRATSRLGRRSGRKPSAHGLQPT
jgi:hypothetical protein